MSIDGDLDPSKYNREQLLGALGRINRERYPLNFEILTRELAARPLESSAAPVDSRPPSIQAATTAIWMATALQSYLVFSLLLHGDLLIWYSRPWRSQLPGARADGIPAQVVPLQWFSILVGSRELFSRPFICSGRRVFAGSRSRVTGNPGLKGVLATPD